MFLRYIFSTGLMLLLAVFSPETACGGRYPPFSPVADTSSAAPRTLFARETSTITADSTWAAPSPGTNPSRAMFHSLVIPGWGQMDNGKKKKAALFFTAEVIFISGYLYENYRVKHESMTEWERSNVRTDRNTFIIYWMISKLLGMVDAYVDAHLAGFDVEDITPEDLRGTETEP